MENKKTKEPSVGAEDLKTNIKKTSKGFEVDNEHFSFTQTVNEITYSTK